MNAIKKELIPSHHSIHIKKTMIFVKQILCTHRINTEPSPIAVIKVLFIGYYSNTSTVPEPRIRPSSPRGHLSSANAPWGNISSTKPQITSSTSTKRPNMEKNSRSAHTNKIMITELIVTEHDVNRGTLFAIFS